jgi:hypothetical protein
MKRMAPMLMTLAILFRFRQYLANRSLWLDEAYLSLNLIHRSTMQLWEPLDYHQGAPVGFLLMQKSIINLLGTSEFALRLLPLVAGVLSVCLFYFLAKKTVPAVPLALALFALSPSLIYYSSEVKQYSMDVMAALLLMYLAIESEWTPRRIAVLGLAGAFAVWLSHPAVFVLVGIGAVILVHERRPAAAFLLAAASFVICYFVVLRKLSHDTVLLTYWQPNFMPFPPKSFSDLKWFEDAFFDFFGSSGALRFTGLAAFAFLVGCISMFRRNKLQLTLLLSPALPALLASGLHKYPFGGRLTLFLVPVALLLMAEGAEMIRQAVPVAGIVLIGLLLVDPGLYTFHRFLAPLKATDRVGVMPTEEIRPVMAYVRTRMQPGDVVYVYGDAHPAFEYYAERSNFPRENLVSHPSGRTWVLFSHMESSDAARFKLWLTFVGSQIESLHAPGAEADLYEVTGVQRNLPW